MPLDLGAAVLIPAVVLAPQAARRLRRNAAWATVMAYAFGVASLFWRTLRSN